MRLIWVCFLLLQGLSPISVPLNRLFLDAQMSVFISLSEGWVTFFVQLEHEGYLSLGFAKGTEDGVVFLIQFQDGIPIISDCQLIGKRRPRCSIPIEPVYNLDDFEILESGAWRAIVRASYNADFEVPINNDLNQFSAAYGFSPLLAYHGPGEGKTFVFQTGFINPISEQSPSPANTTNSTNTTSSTNSTGGSQNTTAPLNQTNGTYTNDPESSIDLPASNTTNSSTPPQPIVRTINPSLYKTKQYRLNALHLTAAILGLLSFALGV